MNELQAILIALQACRESGEAAALATVMRVQGSSYRKPGARMLIRPSGAPIGCVSGGCLEADVTERAHKAMATGQSILAKYDTTEDDETGFGLGMGCKGILHILIEPFLPNTADAFLTFLTEIVTHRRAGVLASVFESEPASNPAQKMLADENGRLLTNLQNGALADRLKEDIDAVLASACSRIQSYRLETGTTQCFLEYLAPPPPLVLFGGGQDAPPLVSLAKAIGWHVTVVDWRPAFVVPERFPTADRMVLARPETVPEQVSIDARTMAVLMTHHYQHDRALLTMLLASPARYIGILGPKLRTARLLEELPGRESLLTETSLSRLYSPAGLDIGGNGPEQIALSIVAEIQAALAGRSGGFLRDRRGPIYDPADAPTSATGFSRTSQEP